MAKWLHGLRTYPPKPNHKERKRDDRDKEQLAAKTTKRVFVYMFSIMKCNSIGMNATQKPLIPMTVSRCVRFHLVQRRTKKNFAQQRSYDFDAEGHATLYIQSQYAYFEFERQLGFAFGAGIDDGLVVWNSIFYFFVVLGECGVGLTFRLSSFANSPGACLGLRIRVSQILGLCPCNSPAIGLRSRAARASS